MGRDKSPPVNPMRTHKNDNDDTNEGAGDKPLSRWERATNIGALPSSWPALPANASLAAEIAWVQSERLYIVKETPGKEPKVNLRRAHSPPPSRAALGWLETSVRNYAKYCDIAARVAGTTEGGDEAVRREKMAIQDIRNLLEEMQPVCPHCKKPLV